MADRLSNPVVTDVRVTVDGVRLSKRHPSAPADIFAGQDFVMLTRYSGSGNGTVRFDGKTASGPVSWTERVTFARDSRENSFVARLWATQRVGYLSAEKRTHGGSREIDDEIRELGEKYAIPTEFTSYLVLEPGMNLQAVTGSVSGARPEARGNRTGGPPPPPAVAAPVNASAKAFEDARAAAQQRSATSLDAADANMIANSDFRRVGTRTFQLRGDTWVDSRKRDEMRVTKVRAFSEAYFRLLDAIPELREAFALGDKVVVAGKSVALEVSDEGITSIDDAALKQIQDRW